MSYFIFLPKCQMNVSFKCSEIIFLLNGIYFRLFNLYEMNMLLQHLIFAKKCWFNAAAERTRLNVYDFSIYIFIFSQKDKK